MSKIYIVAAKRTPQGRFMGALTKRSSVDLGVAAAQAALKDIGAAKIDQVIVGNVLCAGRGMNIARQIAVKAGVPIESPAFTVNMMCASGMQAIILAAGAIKSGEANVVLCGGTESMSNAPYVLERARGGYKLGDGVLLDTLLRDGLVDSFDNEHMGLLTERMAEQYKIGRAAQDEFAAQSQSKYGGAHAKDLFANELVKLPELDKDEHPRSEATVEQLAGLKAAFKKDGTVTAGNASGINDGAAMLVVCDEGTAAENGWKPLAEIYGWANAGCDPKLMGLGPVYATQKLCKGLGIGIEAFDTIELNEAFAAQSLACMQELKLDAKRVNPEGGAIAMGHPIGASGARILVHLAHRVSQGLTKNGLATLCVGGGMGSVVALR
ncbi:MAG: acetyl-CoA acetyltransferase [Planctomycetes bacterium GWF2_50_10]|nr:MAG: acetyl-CoA acetyltransferase [Planctomycetes bacterium GWF2_50_10]